MEQFYYYLRDVDNRPVVTICFAINNGVACRGISICSEKDNPCKKVGRELALYKCLRAFKKGHSGCTIRRPEAVEVIRKARAGWLKETKKSGFHVEPINELEDKFMRAGSASS